MRTIYKQSLAEKISKIASVALIMAFAVSVLPQSASAQPLIIDDFVSGIQTTGPACHSVGYSSHSDASILGGKRQLVVVEGHSCVTGNSPRASVNATTGTAEWYGRSVGNSAVSQTIAYGTAIGNISKPWAVNPEIANGPQTPLNLSLTTADAISLDMAQVDPDTAFIRVELFAGNGQRFAAFFNITAGVNSLPLSNFIGLTDIVAADIDGIEFSGQAGGTSVVLGNGHIFNSIAIEFVVTDSTPPVVTAPAPLTIECNATGGVSSTDTAIQDWLNSATALDDVDGIIPVSNDLVPGLCDVGVTKVVEFSATDAAGNVGSATSTILVTDSLAPSINSASVSSNMLWSPNHKMVPISVTVDASDTCTSASCSITSVTSNEPQNGLGDGDMDGDWSITGPLTVNLRSERSGKGTGRVYTITITCIDTSGNSSTKTVTVSVPHSKAG